MRPNPLMAMLVMSVFEGTKAAIPPGGGIVHDESQPSIIGAKRMQKLCEFERFTRKIRKSNQASQCHAEKTHKASPNKCLPNILTAPATRRLTPLTSPVGDGSATPGNP